MKQIFLSLLFIIGLSVYSQAQTFTVSGYVMDPLTKSGVPGAVTYNKTTGKAAATDSLGKFELAEVSVGDTLITDYLGYFSKTTIVKNDSKLTIELKSEEQKEEVVVIGYQTVNKRDVLGPVSSVKASDIKDVPITDAAQAITGRLAGVQVTTGQGGPGANVSIKIRGGGSLTQDNSPIYIVDGMQVDNALSTLNPQDIESIDVLKDASSTAIYGARGANGVVVITTKSGSGGKTVVTYNSSAGFRELSNKLDVLDPYNYVVYQYERTRSNATDSTGFQTSYGSTWDTLANYRNAKPIDWQEKVFGRKAPYFNNNITVTGGSKTTRFSLSLTSNNEKGIMITSGFDRKIFNFKLEHDLNKKVKVGVNVRYNVQTVSGAGTSDPGSSSNNRLKNTITYQPFESANAGSTVDNNTDYTTISKLVNPVLLTEAEYKRQYQDATNLTGFLSYKVLRDVTFRSTVGYNNNITKDNIFESGVTAQAAQYGNLPLADINNTTAKTFNNSNVLTYSRKEIKKHHNLDVLLGEEILMNSSKKLNTETRYFPANITPTQALANMSLGSAPAGQTQPLPFSYEVQSRMLSFFGRIGYSYDDKYLMSFSMRGDGSSKFAPKNRWGVFPAGSVAWRFIKEKFIKLPKFVSEGKLRMSTGLAGNNRISDFLYTPLFSTSSKSNYGLGGSLVPGYIPNSLANSNLKWETTFSRNLGLDLAFLNNRIQFSVDVYKNSISRLLVDIPIPPQSGYTSQVQNIGKTSNRGLEFQLSAAIIKKENLQWSSNFNLSFNRNRIESLGPVTSKTISSGWQGSDGADDYIMQVGQPIGQMYGFVTDGFYKVEDFDYNASSQTYTLKATSVQNTLFGAAQPGSLKFKDLNGDGVITLDGDRTIIGNANPKFIGGFNNQLAYKNFDLSIFLNWVYGNDVYNANKIEFTAAGNKYTNLTAEMNGRWRTINDQGQVVKDPEQLAALNQDATIWKPMTNYRPYLHSWAVEDGSFLRINNITLGYTLSNKAIKLLKMTKLRVYVTVNNIYTFTKYTGYDPEVNARTATPLTPGVDYSAYPRSRAYVAGVNMTF